MTTPVAPFVTSADVQATFCATLVDEWRRGGVLDAVVCPGSRSTPLAIALADAHEQTGRPRVRVVLDERSAGFVALGMAMASGNPVLLLTTSGTAAAELHPAVVEADLAGVPLLVCTADRPPELRDVGAPQTIDQNRLFGSSVRWFHDPGPPSAESMGSWRSVAARALAEARWGPRGPGPVQLNVAFREPLLGRPGVLPPARRGDSGWHEVVIHGETGSDNALADTLAARWAGRPGVIVAGAGAGDRAEVLRLAAALRWPVLADPRSGCRVPAMATVAGVDALLRSEAIARHLAPDVVLRVGAPWASKVLGGWLARAAEDVLVDPHGSWADPHRTANLVIRTDPTQICRTVADALGADARRSADTADPAGSARLAAWESERGAAWMADWQAAELAAQRVFDSAARAGITEPALARALAAALPPGSRLVVSSSMPVRDVEWYGPVRDGLHVLANRGANGIDGVISTVLGVASAGLGPTVGLLGDLAALHDIGAMVTAAALGTRATLVVIDNGGGGIFEFLPQATGLDRERFELLFGTPQRVDLAAVFGGFGGKVQVIERPGSVGEFVAAVLDDLSRPGVGVVLVRTDRRVNVADHDEIHRQVIVAAEAALGLASE